MELNLSWWQALIRHKIYMLQFGRVGLCHWDCMAVREQITQRLASLSLEFSKTQLDKSRANLTQCGD